MALRRRRQNHRKNPRGTLLAFIAVAIQAMLPFFLAVEIARASNPAFGDSIPICSSLGPAGHQTSGTAGDHQGGTCPICAAVAAAQGFTAPPVPPLPLPVACGHVVSATTDTPRLSFDAASPYQSRAPPAIA